MKENQKCRIDIGITENEELEMEIATAILNQIKLKLKDENSLTPSEIASLASSALKAQKLFKNVTPKIISSPKDTESFQRAMELLDEVADLKRRDSK